MTIENGRQDVGGGPEDAGGSAPNGWVPPSHWPPVEPSAMPSPFWTRLRRLIRTSLRLSAFAALAIAFGFLGGWLGPSVSQDDSPSASTSSTSDELVAALLPESGVTLDVRWGDLPRRLVQEGVIDLEKFRAAAQGAGSPLTPDQLGLLADGSDEPITFDSSNAYFLLDVLWALGLANDNTVLREGPMAQSGWDQAGGYASTGGWTIGEKPGPEYLAALPLIRLTPEQQAVVKEVAYNSYRPCCGNMTAFPDCNHGMAALGMAELMASQGATEDEIFQAVKSFNAFWFPQQYSVLATHFARQWQSWDKIDAREIVSAQFSSSQGWAQVNQAVQSGSPPSPRSPSRRAPPPRAPAPCSAPPRT